MTGQFLSAFDRVREILVKSIYQKTDYEQRTAEELAQPRTVLLIMTNCAGGVVRDALAIHGLLRWLKTCNPKITFSLHCIGCIQSAALLVMTSPMFEKVTIDAFSTFRIHSATTGALDAATKKRLFTQTSLLDQAENIIIDMYAQAAARRAKPVTDWQTIMDNGDDNCFITANEILAYGLCDEIM